MTVFLTTHYLDEADALCDRIAIIDHGEIVAEGTPTELKREISGDVVTVGRRRRRPSRPARCWTSSRSPTASRSARTTGCGSTSTTGDTAIPQIMRALEGAGIDARRRSSCTARRLDDVFLTKTGRSLRD